MSTATNEPSQKKHHDFGIFAYNEQSREDSPANTFSAAAAAAISSVDRSNAAPLPRLPGGAFSRASAVASSEEEIDIINKMQKILSRHAPASSKKNSDTAAASGAGAKTNGDGTEADSVSSFENDLAFLRGENLPSTEEMDDAEGDDADWITESALLGVEQYNAKCNEIKVLSSMAVQDRLHCMEFIIPQYRIGSLGGIALGAAFRVTSHVTVIDIGHNGLGDNGVNAILDALSQSRNAIQRINLEANSIGPGATPSIANFIRASKNNLKSLSIAHNQFHDASLRTVLEALISDALEIEEVNLSYTGLGDASAPLLCSLVETRATVQSLGLAWNLISGAWDSIFETIGATRNLRVLDVSFNQSVGDKHDTALADCVAQNAALKTLDVSGCRLNKCASSMAEALRENKSLETLMLDESTAQATAEHVYATDDFKCRLAIRNNVAYSESDMDMTFDTEEAPNPDQHASRSRQSSLFKGPDGSSAEGSNGEVLKSLAKEFEELTQLASGSQAGGSDAAVNSDMDQDPGNGSANKQGMGQVLHDLEESLTAAQAASRKNPRSVIALKAQITTSMALEKWHNIAEQCIDAIQDAKASSENDNFNQAVIMIRQRRKRYLGPRRRIRLRMKTLRGLKPLDSSRATPAVVEENPLRKEYELLLKRIDDLVSLHDSHPVERNCMRDVFKKFDSVIRRLFIYYRDGVVSEQPAEKQATGGGGDGNGDGDGDDDGRNSSCWEDPPEGTIKASDLWRLMHDCQVLTSNLGIAEVDRILARSQRHGEQVEIDEKVVADGGRLMPEVPDLHNGTKDVTFFDCYEVLIRAAWVSHSAASPAMHGRLLSLIKISLEPFACTDSRDRVKRQAQAGRVDFNQVHKTKIIKIYRFFSSRKDSKSLAVVGGDSSSAGASIDEGDSPMNYNDLLNLSERLELFHPGLNHKKLASLVEATVGTGQELLPQVHANNSKVEIIYEEFAEVLGRMALASAGAGAASAALKSNRFIDQLEKYLASAIYPAASKVLPVRL